MTQQKLIAYTKRKHPKNRTTIAFTKNSAQHLTNTLKKGIKKTHLKTNTQGELTLVCDTRLNPLYQIPATDYTLKKLQENYSKVDLFEKQKDAYYAEKWDNYTPEETHEQQFFNTN